MFLSETALFLVLKWQQMSQSQPNPLAQEIEEYLDSEMISSTEEATARWQSLLDLAEDSSNVGYPIVED